MSRIRKRRVSADRLAADREALRNLKKLADYAPRNPAYSVEALLALEARLIQCEEAEAEGELALDRMRDETTGAGNDLREAMGGARQEMRAQYGENSVNLHAVGLKTRDEYKRPTRKAKPVV